MFGGFSLLLEESEKSLASRRVWWKGGRTRVRTAEGERLHSVVAKAGRCPAKDGLSVPMQLGAETHALPSPSTLET